MALPLFLPAKHHVTLELVQGTRTGGSGGGGAGELCGSGAETSTVPSRLYPPPSRRSQTCRYQPRPSNRGSAGGLIPPLDLMRVSLAVSGYSDPRAREIARAPHE